MEVSKLIQNMREQGIGIWTEGGKIRYLKKDGKLDDDIKNILIYNKKEIISYFEEERERFDKFPLTDIQMAYLLGRKNSFEYGDVASHLYLELDYPALDSVKVQKIWNQLIDKHDMLRAIVLEDGTQEVLRDVAEYPIYISTKCEEIRSKWSDKYYNTETWPMFDIGVTEDKEKTTLHLSFDFLIADWASIWTLLIEFETIYYNKGNGDEKCAISFRNYVLNEMGMKNSSRYRSIWSIYHECKMGESYNSSIPYGVPLSNQGFEVLDANMKPCPDMVQGELYITGKGLAKEYLGDVSKTQSSFFWLNNKRIYKTGDFGRYLRNGEIEFLGRKDSQIKISGHRIDTGEIENAIMDCCSGKNCCVTTVDWNNEPKLVAVIVPKEDEKKDEKSVREALKRYLPQYMIPFFLQFIDEIPCTSNGKVDRQAIRKLFIDKRDDKIQHKRWELENLIDKEIYSILISVLKVDALYPDDNLFELGADSLLMAQIAGRVKEIIEQTKTSVTFDEILRQILNNPTGEAITTFVKSKQNILTSENVRTDDFRIIEKTAKDTVYIFFHTALGTTNCYRFVEKELRKEDLGDFLFINVEDVEWYYSIQYHELVDRITDEYVRKIEQLHYKNINLIGYCLGGILALNVAVKLLEKGIEVNNLFVIDSYPVSGKVEDQFIDEVIFLPNYQLMLSEVLEDVDDFKVMEFITEVRKRNNGNIPQNTFFNIIEKDTKMKNNSGLWEFVNSTKEKRFEAYAKAIEKKTCINVSAELLEATFEIYQHGFKGANVELPFYSGDICYLSACEEQKYFFADKNQNLEMWNDICLGEFEVINVPGNHVTCIHSEENATLLAQIIIERNIRG